MRTARIKSRGRAFYHCISRVVDKQMILGDIERDKFRDLMRGCETFAGVRIVTYALLSNHLHIMVEVPQRVMVDEAGIRRRLAALYSDKEVARIEMRWEGWRKEGQERLVEADLERFRLRMYDVSEFMKTLKQRFTLWYNIREQRTGTLWEDRFKSVLVEQPPHYVKARSGAGALKTIAAYIDLNPVRAGLVADPKDYRWSGYGEAVAGKMRAREGLALIYGTDQSEWRRFGESYRTLLYAAGKDALSAFGQIDGRELTAAEIEAHIKEHGTLSLAAVLHCRVRYFSDGLAIGSKAFVNQVFKEYRDRFGEKRKSGARRLKGADWGGLCTARDLRRAPLGLVGRG